MKKITLVLFLCVTVPSWAQDESPADFPVRGFCIGAPGVKEVASRSEVVGAGKRVHPFTHENPKLSQR